MSFGLEIHDAASTGDYDSLEEYLRSGKFDVNLKDEEWNNRTALHWACGKGYVECVRLLLDFGAVGTSRTDTGWTPAHFAAETGKLHALRALFNANISVASKDKYGDTPRRIAEIYGQTECIKFLERCAIEKAMGIKKGVSPKFTAAFRRRRVSSLRSESAASTNGTLSGSAPPSPVPSENVTPSAEEEQKERGVEAEEYDPSESIRET